MDQNQQKGDIAPEATQGSQRGELLNMRLSWKSGLVIVTGVILLGIIVTNLGTDNDDAGRQVIQLTEEQINLSTQSITGYPEVLDAAITQDRDRLSLVLIVNDATSIERAKELGDNFVRQVKTFGPDTSPGRDIGKGEYSYLIGVYGPDEELLVQGAKSAISREITW